MMMTRKSAAGVSVATVRLPVRSRGQGDIIDLTGDIEARLAETGMREGQVTVFVNGSTGAVSAVEFEPGLVKDLKRLYEQLAPRQGDYEHHKTWGDDNGSGHVRATLQGPSLSVPFVDGRLILGTWQQVVFLEFDTRPRDRNLVVQFMGA